MKLLVLAIDGRGLGHLNRTVLLARSLVAVEPTAQVRFLVESPAFGLVAKAGFEVLKLPDPMHPLGRLALDCRRGQLEAELMAPVLSAWRPDGVLVDFVVDPVLFQTIHRHGCRLLLVVRKLKPRAMAELAADPAARLVDAFVLPHDPSEFEPGEIPESLRRCCHFTGPLVRRLDVARIPKLRQRWTGESEGRGELVVVSLGGGGWAGAVGLAEAAHQALRELLGRRPGLRAVLVYGPLYAGRLPADEPGLRAVRFVAELPELMAAADAVVCTAGYNSAAELVASGTPGVLVPLADPGRDDQAGRAEQIRLSGRALVARREPGEIAAALEKVLSGRGPKRQDPSPGGDERRAGQVLVELLRS